MKVFSALSCRNAQIYKYLPRCFAVPPSYGTAVTNIAQGRLIEPLHGFCSKCEWQLELHVLGCVSLNVVGHPNLTFRLKGILVATMYMNFQSIRPEAVSY